jgi:hypothetical protein
MKPEGTFMVSNEVAFDPGGTGSLDFLHDGKISNSKENNAAENNFMRLVVFIFLVLMNIKDTVYLVNILR